MSDVSYKAKPSKLVSVSSLNLDLENFRSQPQKSEIDSINNLILASPEWFWGLINSFLEFGYDSLEGIGVLRTESKKLIVLEGNRRIAALKIVLGLVNRKKISIPPSIIDKISVASDDLLLALRKVPCYIYDLNERADLERIINRTHSPEDKAGRLSWESISKARRSRSQGNPEPELDLLEHIFRIGNNHSESMASKWNSKYPYTVYTETISQTAKTLGISIYDLRDRYPNDIPEDIVKLIDKLIPEIGNGEIQFADIRTGRKINPQFYLDYGFYKLPETPTPLTSEERTSSEEEPTIGNPPSAEVDTPSFGTSEPDPTPNPPRVSSPPFGSPRHIDSLLKDLKPKGIEFAKIRSLIDELKSNHTDKTPNAFVVITRCIIELACTLYCEQNSISLVKQNGSEKKLVDIIKDVHAHLLKNVPNGKTEASWKRDMDQPLTELTNPIYPLSTNMMNVIVHRRNANANMKPIRTSFANIHLFLKAIGL